VWNKFILVQSGRDAINWKSGNTPRASLILRVKSKLGVGYRFVVVIHGHRWPITSSIRVRKLYWHYENGCLLWCAYYYNRKYFCFATNGTFYFSFPFSDKSRAFLHINLECSMWVVRCLFHFRAHSSENPVLFYIFSPFVITEQADVSVALCKCNREVKVKVKESRYRPGVAQRVPGS